MKMHQIILSAASGQHGRIVLIDLFRHHHQRPAQQALIASIDLFLQNSQKLFKIGLGLFRRHLILHPCRGRPFPLGVDKGKGIIKSCLSYYIQRIQKILEYSQKLRDYIQENEITKERLMQEYSLQWLVTTPLYNIGETLSSQKIEIEQPTIEKIQTKEEPKVLNNIMNSEEDEDIEVL